MNAFLDSLIKDKKVYYIYRIDKSIYGIETNFPCYKVITAEEYTVPSEYAADSPLPDTYIYDKVKFILSTTAQFFQDIVENKMPAWECCCLGKKFIIKEYIKLQITPNKKFLKKNYDEFFHKVMRLINQTEETEENLEAIQNWYFLIIKYLKFANQILLFNKIVDFKEVASDYLKLAETTLENVKEVFNTLKKPAEELFIKRTI